MPMLLLQVIWTVVRAPFSKNADLVAENLARRHHNHEKGIGC